MSLRIAYTTRRPALSLRGKSLIIGTVNLLLVLWVTSVALDLVRSFLPGSRVANSIPPPQMVIPDPALPTPGENARRLVALHLFGEPTPEPPVTTAVPTSGPVTALKLVLHGTFAKVDSRDGQALIADSADTVEHYTVGDALPGGGTLAAIHTDRVILERNGRYEMLPLWHDNVAFVVPAPESVDTAGPADGAPIIRELPRTLLDQAKPRPVRKDGRFVGFRLTPIKDPRLFDTSGLQPDDVITWINGTDLDNPLKGMKALRRLSRGNYVNMAVQRDGRPMSLSFYLP